jgi:hypothetical protein
MRTISLGAIALKGWNDSKIMAMPRVIEQFSEEVLTPAQAGVQFLILSLQSKERTG